ncbi:hypothetical protein NDU88_001094 [Pleurodeles waltl]|uniref:Uncharacterized protein n=1 Tax=Pleurodeles waltl TaxID=8319 RepID=A0AAV7TIR4_PLEWA|nr:hypothetical protein NDU88_001094 [Pleurodeles waltl]
MFPTSMQSVVAKPEPLPLVLQTPRACGSECRGATPTDRLQAPWPTVPSLGLGPLARSSPQPWIRAWLTRSSTPGCRP